ncbi:MAG: hypothetical protein AAF449_15350 [Myxococcota bacterium]
MSNSSTKALSHVPTQPQPATHALADAPGATPIKRAYAADSATTPISDASQTYDASDFNLLYQVPTGLATPEQQLERFIRFQGVPAAQMNRVGQNTIYRGREKMAAKQMYAIIYDAAHHGKVNPERAQRLIKHVLPALIDGRLRITLKDDASFIAAYHGKNSRTGRYTPNTLYLPADGINIYRRATRGILVHESEHISHDAMRIPRSRLESERLGHAAFAEYMLRDVGALVPVKGGLRLDNYAFHRIQFEHYGTVDRKMMFEIFAAAAQKNADQGRLHLNGAYAGFGDRVGEKIVEISGLSGSFEDIYVNALQKNSLRHVTQTRSEIKRALSMPVPSDGL